MILQLLEGAFGYLWLGCGALGIVFVIGWLFADWSGWNVVWAFVASSIGKWLAVGFLDSKNRVAFEAALVERGCTPEEAGREWVKRYTARQD